MNFPLLQKRDIRWTILSREMVVYSHLNHPQSLPRAKHGKRATLHVPIPALTPVLIPVLARAKRALLPALLPVLLPVLTRALLPALSRVTVLHALPRVMILHAMLHHVVRLPAVSPNAENSLQ